MKRLAVLATVAAVTFVAGCASSTKVTITSTPPVAITVAASTAPASTPTVAPTSAGSALPAVSTTASTPDSTADVAAPPKSSNIVTISLIVGKNSSPTRVEKVKLGSVVQISLLNPDAKDSFHLHGVDIEQDQRAGQQGLMSFTADTPGSFALESHGTSTTGISTTVLLTVVVA